MEQPHEDIAAISISEIEQRQKRRDNIVVFGLDEPDAATAEDRNNQDSQAVQEVLEKIEAVSKIKDKKKGWKTPSSESDCTRPIRTEKNTEQGESTGKSRRAVKNGKHQEGHDTEREERRDSKRREATEKGEKDVVWSIWRGKVVKRKPPQPEADNYRLIKNAQKTKEKRKT